MRSPSRCASAPAATRIDRRSFFAALGAVGVAIAVRPARAQTAILTDEVGIETDSTDIAVTGGSMPIFFAKPVDADSLPTILVVEESYGVNDYLRDVCRRLAKLGYLAVAPELFFRQGNPAPIGDRPALSSSAVSRIADAQVMSDLDACVAWAVGNGGDPRRIAATGFDWGGRIVWLYATHNSKLAAATVWYGLLDTSRTRETPLQPADVVERLKVPVLGLYGGKDREIPPEDIETLRARLALADEECSIVVYPEAGHAFHADYRSTYRPAEATDGWQRMLDWFKRQGM
ncbi:MAG TPA: dienelactone hydrolase family protein [Aromatoleum sp.]|uniref:dienelactone hydrolase family protein n=1 Tax=Aromatoleum sp. TaxID=2307007 RepID=UPI002B4A5C90|nr:dienelactone hydrolase family protein [Aromatoleum sp.]HJV26506.1 dienelactone hydrolase family protein [Aromatoleum sp.]